MNSKEFRTKRCQVLGVMLIYLFAALTHIFFLTPEHSSINHTHNSIFKRKIEAIHNSSLVERTAKATFKETIKSLLAEVPLTYLDLFIINHQAKSPGLKISFSISRHNSNSRYSYISFCIFRV